MKTSMIEMRDMLAVLTVEEVEKHIGAVPGVESATVNYAAKNATVRYDETLLDVADIKVLVHQRSKQSAGEQPHQRTHPDASSAAPLAVAAQPSPAAANDAQPNKAITDAPPSTPMSGASKPSTNASTASLATVAASLAADQHQHHAEPGALAKVTAWVKETFAGEEHEHLAVCGNFSNCVYYRAWYREWTHSGLGWCRGPRPFGECVRNQNE